MGELQERMTQEEFLSWQEFYVLYPFDDYYRFHRPAALIAHHAAGGGSITARLEWLAPDRSMDDLPDADHATLQAFGITRRGEST